jgi:hypothetical protein
LPVFFCRDTIQAFASSITNALAFSAILEGMGVGDEKASVLSATFVWLVKDGVGMLGRILFAWFHGTGNPFSSYSNFVILFSFL